MNQNAIISSLTLADYRRLIRREKHAIRKMKREIANIEDQTISDKSLSRFIIAALLFHIAVVAITILAR